jgi:DNA gyrase/topoisomerase IV subunit B
MSVDPEQSNISFFSRTFDLTTDKIPQKEKVNVTLKQLQAGDEVPLNVAFKPNTAIVDPAAESELKRLVRVAKANPSLKFEIQVLLSGYEEDTVKSSADLTELIVDSVRTRVNSMDTVLVRNTYHNDRTRAQAQALIDYFVSQGADSKSFRYFVNAIPAVTPQNRKLTVKAVVR